METTLSYLQTRGLDVLKRTLLLVDARHGIMKQDEVGMVCFAFSPPSLILLLLSFLSTFCLSFFLSSSLFQFSIFPLPSYFFVSPLCTSIPPPDP